MVREELMRIAAIKEVIKETNNIVTLRLNSEINSLPGQFVMVWVPNYDEKPFTLSYIGKDAGITVLKKGETTSKLHTMKEGELLGIRGPFGRGFKIIGDKVIMIGGGVGMATIAPAAEDAVKKGKDTTVIIGAVTKKELLFAERLKKAGAKVVECTDDGSCGIKGYTTDALKTLLGKEKFDSCYTCGPEKMMVRIFDITKKHGIPAQFAMERYFKCGGLGLCGACVMDDGGARVCREGPVFRDVEVEKFKDFGKYSRDASGKKIFW